ncbi:hypothetical protein [Alkaliphilus peptidifermentans]|uniref:Uncharacterized protein n=1 Tax=Alkaliphilus peptidifermentans DSM 18978 TaxID=1120976 RepID=A0A1G5CPQ6_9FIRM|nr:hypothetical protein [Alkaliphilus peptidifermentans]SCY04344.1 hypothetical protein SAMN03080606_00727 [Alkaliphilus peptidifermentans DSM 18978]
MNKKYKTYITPILSIILMVMLISGCTTIKEEDINVDRQGQVEELKIEEIILPYYCGGVAYAPEGVKVIYLPESSKDNNKITVKFNKELSDENIMNLYYIQTGGIVPIISMENKLPAPRPFERYRIKDNTIEIGDNWKGNYLPPMMFSGLFLPKELLGKDGSKLENDMALFFSLGIPSPHGQFLEINAVMEDSLTPTLVIPMYSENSLWNNLSNHNPKVGYVIKTSADIYNDKELTERNDEISFGANVELIEKYDDYYYVYYYLPRDIEDPKHFSYHTLQYNMNIFDSEHVIKREGYVKSDDLGLIEPFDNKGCKIIVYTTGLRTINGTLELYIGNTLYPYSGAGYRLYHVENDTEIRSDEVLNRINNIHINALELNSYLSVDGMLGDGYSGGYLDENNMSMAMEDKRQHEFILDFFKADRQYIMRMFEVYNNFIFDSWNKAASNIEGEKYKEDVDFVLESISKRNYLWYKWSEIDPELKRETYINLIIDNFAATDEEKEEIRNYFRDNEAPLIEQMSNLFVDMVWSRLRENEIEELVNRAFE